MPDKLTIDPYVVIEEQRTSYVRYRSIVTGRRWEVRGICDRRGDCLIGANLKSIFVETKAQLIELAKTYPGQRLDTELDVPVTPEFDSCCGSNIFQYTELPPL